MKKATYKSSGVDIKKAGIFKEKVKLMARKSFCPSVLKDIGGFGSFFKFDSRGYKKPVLVSSSDGVGTKLKIAFLADKHDTVGIDAVAMNANDLICTGAAPLFFLDYIAYSELKPATLIDIVKGINEGCIASGLALIGGETAQMPGMYKKGEYDIAGFCVGAVEEDRIIDGSNIRAGDIVIGLESNGLHSNGFSLVRKVLSKAEQKRMSKELLKPTRIYVKPLLDLLVTSYELLVTIKGIAHITGGAFYDKIGRILPENVDAHINKGSWPVPEIFRLIQEKGRIEDKEMYHTFNMGIGMVIIVNPGSKQDVIEYFHRFKIKCFKIGEIVKGNGKAKIV